jgi:hypothetical protein
MLAVVRKIFTLSQQLGTLAQPAASHSPYTLEDVVLSGVPASNRLAEYESRQGVDQFERPTRMPTMPDLVGSVISREDFSFDEATPIESAKLLKKKQRINVPDIETTERLKHREPARTNALEKVSMVLLVLAVIGASAWGGMHLLRKSKQAAITVPETLDGGQAIAPPPITKAEQVMIEDAIRGFHEATNVESKAAYLMKGELMHDKLLGYYRRKPMESLVERIGETFETRTIDDARYLRSQGIYENGQPFEVLLSCQGERFLID